jgi:ribosome modulation factor
MNDAYQAGYDAFKKRLPQDDNPFADEAERQQWDEGWEEGKMDADLHRRSICSEHETDPA